MKLKHILTGRLAVVLLAFFVLTIGCKKVSVVERTTGDVNITGYLDKHPEYSEFRKILGISKTSGFLQAYGAYTLFLPSNEAIKAYLKEKGLASVEELGTPDQLKELVYLHLIIDSIKTTDFSDGKLRNATMQGQYLTTGATNDGQSSSITINKQANLIKGNISVGNGIIHVIDNVLSPNNQTVASILETDPKFSIFFEALKETKLYDRLNKKPLDNTRLTERHLTVFAETNEALAAAGYDTYEKLKERYSHTGNPSNPDDSLYLYVAYHISPSATYYPELITSASANTLAVPTLSISRNEIGQVVINELKIGDELELGAPIKRSESDISANNGVVHTVTSHFRIIKRTAQPVYYDVADQPEFRRLPEWKTGTKQYAWNTIPKLTRILWSNSATVNMVYVGNDPGAAGGDYLTMPLGAGPTRPQYYEITTPYVSAGKYRMWVCYKRASSSAPGHYYYFNGRKLDRLIDMDVANPVINLNEQQREQAGWKQYVNGTIGTYMGRSLGVVEVTKDGPQKIRMEVNPGSFQTPNHLDMIHLIPVDMDQIWPRFDVNGKKILRPENPTTN